MIYRGTWDTPESREAKRKLIKAKAEQLRSAADVLDLIAESPNEASDQNLTDAANSVLKRLE